VPKPGLPSINPERPTSSRRLLNPTPTSADASQRNGPRPRLPQPRPVSWFLRRPVC